MGARTYGRNPPESFGLTKYAVELQLLRMPSDDVTEVLKAYPQIYHACHLEHSRARSNPRGISNRDGWILGHLDLAQPTAPRTLARHLALGASTVSEAVRRLERLGYAVRRRPDGDRRRVEIFLTPRGAAAMRATSVLDAGRVGKLIAQLPKQERAAAMEGLALLAKAARALNQKEPKRWQAGGE